MRIDKTILVSLRDEDLTGWGRRALPVALELVG